MGQAVATVLSGTDSDDVRTGSCADPAAGGRRLQDSGGRARPARPRW